VAEAGVGLIFSVENTLDDVDFRDARNGLDEHGKVFKGLYFFGRRQFDEPPSCKALSRFRMQSSVF